MDKMPGWARLWTALMGLVAGFVLTTGAFAASPPPDGLRVILCGTSGPLPIRDRAKACVAVQAGGKLYFVDMGPEAVKNLQLWRLPLASVGAVFITHLHSDHIGDLGEFNLQSWVAGRTAPLQVIGPDGVEDLVAGMNRAYGPDHGFRRAHHEHDGVTLPLAIGLMQVKTITLPSSPDAQGVRRATVLVDGELKVTAIAVDHTPINPAFGYRFDYKGRSVVISGDTRYHPPLAVASKGADLLIHEAQNADMTRTMVAGLKGMGMVRMSSIMNDTISYHTTPVEAAEIAKAAGVRMLVLTHLTQAGLPFYTPETFTKGMDVVGFTNWKLAQDGMILDLPTGSTDIVVGKE